MLQPAIGLKEAESEADQALPGQSRETSNPLSMVNAVVVWFASFNFCCLRACVESTPAACAALFSAREIIPESARKMEARVG